MATNGSTSDQLLWTLACNHVEQLI